MPRERACEDRVRDDFKEFGVERMITIVYRLAMDFLPRKYDVLQPLENGEIAGTAWSVQSSNAD